MPRGEDDQRKTMTLKTIYDVTISLLTPLHIGSGRELRRDYDYVTHAGKTWVMDADAFLEAIYLRDGKFDERIIGRPAAELLQPQDFREDSSYFRYVLSGQPRAQGHGAVLREQYKDAFQRPYLPGSTIKGALRTVLAWHGFQQQKLKLDVGEMSGSRSWAGQPLERKLFGQNPNYDLLRALQIADSTPQSTERLQIVNAQVVTGSEKMGSPIEVEAVRLDTEFTTTITIDDYLHSEEAEARLRFGQRWSWLEQLPKLARTWAAELVMQERNWYRSRKYDNVGRFYHQLLANLKQGGLGENQLFLPLGWGGGWSAKTIGAPLQQDAAAWERLLGDKRLSPARFSRRAGDIFPKSRRAVVVNQQVMAPLGWCLVEMKKRG